MYANRRDSNEPAIIEALERSGCMVDILDRKPYDLLVARAGRNYLLEVKTAKGALKTSQLAFQRSWIGQYAVVRSPEEALAAVGIFVRTEGPK